MSDHTYFTVETYGEDDSRVPCVRGWANPAEANIYFRLRAKSDSRFKQACRDWGCDPEISESDPYDAIEAWTTHCLADWPYGFRTFDSLDKLVEYVASELADAVEAWSAADPLGRDQLVPDLADLEAEHGDVIALLTALEAFGTGELTCTNKHGACCVICPHCMVSTGDDGGCGHCVNCNLYLCLHDHDAEDGCAVALAKVEEKGEER